MQYYSGRQIASALAHVFGVDTQLIEDGTYFVAEAEKRIAGSGGWSKRKTLYGGDQSKSDKVDALLEPATEAATAVQYKFYLRTSYDDRLCAAASAETA